MPLHSRFSARLTISIDPEVKAKIQHIARVEERSDADIVREAIDEFLRSREQSQGS